MLRYGYRQGVWSSGLVGYDGPRYSRRMAKRSVDRVIRARVSVELEALVKRAADRERRTVSDWARITLEDAARAQLAADDKRASG